MTTADSVKQHVLLVEDDEELAGLIKEYLESAELRVDIQSVGTDAVERILELNPDLVILDLMLPGKDGISICREVRSSFTKPILMLTASNESVDHIIGLEVGADDFMHKPVEPRILLAHVRALLRRVTNPPVPAEESGSTEQQGDPLSNQESSYALNFGDVAIDATNRLVKLSDQLLDLSTPEYDILVLLAQNQGQILSRDDIFQSLRGIEYDGQNRLVDITVCQLRAKLGIDGHSHRHIQTIRNKGYVCVTSIA